MHLKALCKYHKTAAMAAASYVGDSPLFLLDYLLRFLRVVVLLSLWRTILAGKDVVSGMSLGMVLTYTLIAEVLAEPLACRTRIVDALWDGSITTRLLHPVALFGEFAAEACGRWAFNLGAFSLPLLLCAPLLGVNPRPAGAGAAGTFVLSLALSISVGLATDYVLAAVMVILQLHRWAIEGVRRTLTVLLTGALLPLALWPWGLGCVFAWLPFASMAWAPLAIYTGMGDAWHLLAVQAGWSAVLWPLAHGLWRWHRERLVSYGG